jgi:hypothetical protein
MEPESSLPSPRKFHRLPDGSSLYTHTPCFAKICLIITVSCVLKSPDWYHDDDDDENHINNNNNNNNNN